MFLRHPNIYIEAFLHNTYKYMYPFIRDGKDFYGLHKRGINNIRYNIKDKQACGLDLSFYFHKNVRILVDNCLRTWCAFPLLDLTVSSGTYTWLLIICAGLLLRFFERWGMTVLIAPMFCLLCNLAGPVNGSIRYTLPLIACTPTLIAWLVICFRLREGNYKFE